MKRNSYLLACLLLIFVAGLTGFTSRHDKSPRFVDFTIWQYGDAPPGVLILDDLYNLHPTLEKLEPGKYIIHYDPISCLFHDGFMVSNGGNLVEATPLRNFSLGYWVCGQAVLTVTDLQGEYTDGFIVNARITVYPGSQITP